MKSGCLACLERVIKKIENDGDGQFGCSMTDVQKLFPLARLGMQVQLAQERGIDVSQIMAQT